AFDGLKRWKAGEITPYGSGINKREGKVNELLPNSLFQDNRGRIWVSTLDGVGYLEGKRFITISGVPGGNVTSIMQDTAENLWIANEHAGLIQLFRGNVVQQIPWASLGRRDFASTLVADPLHGGLWLGFLQGGVAYFANGKVSASYGVSDGFTP